MKRQSLRKYAVEVTCPSSIIGRMGLGSSVRFLLQRAYRIGLHNGKLIAAKKVKK